MKKSFALSLLLLLFPALSAMGQTSSSHILTPKMLAMPRQQMHFRDPQVLLFNGRGYVNPQEFSMTGFENMTFPPVSVPFYHFYINILDTKSGTLIQDDVPKLWRNWVQKGTGTDPLGANFRPGFATVMVTQDENWEPDLYTRTGTFYKDYNGHWVNFSMKTWTSVSSQKDEIYIKERIYNRGKDNLKLVLMPVQSTPSMTAKPSKNKRIYHKDDAFTISNGHYLIRVSSSLKSRNKKGFLLDIPAKSEKIFYFVIHAQPVSQKKPLLHENDIAQRMAQAANHIKHELQWAANQIPSFHSNNQLLNDFYRRCLLSVLMCRWQRKNFISDPFWSVGTWVFTIDWDTSFSASLLAMLEPKSLKQAILTDLREVKMKHTYIGWNGPAGNILYIQEPFALQIMIQSYLRQTGDWSILNDKAGGITVLNWLKKWAHLLHDKYGTGKGSLINLGNANDKLLELRTDGYDYIVPAVNGLAVKLYRKIAYWSKKMHAGNGQSYMDWASVLEKSINKYLWDPQKGWYDNMYPDGSKSAIWTYHLFDLLGTSVLSPYQQDRLVDHITNGVFLGKYGFYSIARIDSVHWDRIDADWGGGGQYAGMPLQISRQLFNIGRPFVAWQVLYRFAHYVKHFPYIPQNPQTDRAYEDLSSQPLEISAGSGIEAIVFGMLGIHPHVDGTLTINPYYEPKAGKIILDGYRFRGHSFSLHVNRSYYRVYEDGHFLLKKRIGLKTTLNVQ